jgi:hypothetical protein
MPRAFDRGRWVSIPHQRRGSWPLFRQLLTLCVHRPGHKRRGGGCFKPTWYVRRVVFMAPKGAADDSGLRRRVSVVDPAPETG